MPAQRYRVLEIAVVLLLAAVGVALAFGSRSAPAFHGRLLEPLRAAPELALLDQYGEPFRLADHRGEAVLLFFGYTTCPDVCPATLGTFAQVKKDLGNDAGRVRFVFVTVDPERDTPARLREYLAHFDPAIVGLTGTPAQLAAVREAYGVYAERVNDPNAPGGYWMNHTATVVLVDPQGRLRLSYSFGAEAKDLVEDLRAIYRG